MLEKIIKKVSSETQGVIDAAQEKARSLRDDHVALKRNLGDFALEKVVDQVDQFNAALPLFEKVGFALIRFDIEIGISPGISARFDIVRKPTEEEQQAALTEAAGDSTLETLLKAMFNATRLHRHVHIGDLELLGLVVSISTMPSVKLVFVEDHAKAPRTN